MTGPESICLGSVLTVLFLVGFVWALGAAIEHGPLDRHDDEGGDR